MTKKKRFSFRCDQIFLDEIDDWRRRGTPILSQSEAIRFLALRGAAMDSYLSVILENSLSDLISAGIVSHDPNSETYKRFQKVVTDSIDQAALVNQQTRQRQSKLDVVDDPRPSQAQERPSLNKIAPKRQRYSR